MTPEPQASAASEQEPSQDSARELHGEVDFDGCIKTANPVWETTLGFAPEDLNGTLFLDLIHPEDEERARAALRQLAQDGAETTLSLRCRHRDGPHVLISWRLSASRDERLYHVLGRDDAAPTPREEHKLSELGLVAAVVAHDLNNVLSVVRGCSAMLKSSIDPASPLVRELDDIERATRHGAELVEQVLVHCGRGAPTPHAVDPNQALAEMDWMPRRLIPKNVAFDVLLAPGLGRIVAEAATLRQAVLNLVLNAREAMPAGGQISLETARVVVEEQDARTSPPLPPGDYVRISVSDTGTGISAEAQTRLFEPFRTTKPGGTGLGLYSVAQAVAGCAGHVRVRSRPGAGATFEIYLPRAQA